MSRWRILVTAQAFAVSGELANRSLLNRDCEVIIANQFGPLPLDQLIQQAERCDAVIAATDPYEAATFHSLPNLKLVARCGVGIDCVNLNEATEAGVIITNVPHAMTDAVADYCFGLLLTLVRRIHEGFICMIGGGWAEFPGIELRGKTLGLIGSGKIGQAVADRAFGFGLRVITYDPIGPDQATLTKYAQVEWVSLDELLSSSDFVSVHAPNIPSTRSLINAATLSMMKSDSVLINTSRGALIDEQALMASLHCGQLGGAAIDVYCQEPLPADHPLRKTPRLLLTPHNAFNSREAAQRMSWGCAQPILDLLDGKVPEFVCNRDVLNSTELRVAGLRKPS